MIERELHPVLTCEEAAEWEASFLTDKEKEWEAMQKVGRKLGSSLYRDFQEAAFWSENARILLLVGKGHNGGDALLAAATLAKMKQGLVVDILSPSGPETWKPLTRRAWEVLENSLEKGPGTARIYVWPRGPENPVYDVALDGLLGMQFRPPLRSPFPALFEKVRDWRIGFRAAVDLPSGLHEKGDGMILSSDVTYLTGIAKKPVFGAEAGNHVGRIRYLDIGFFDHGAPGKEGGSQQPSLLTKACLDELRQPRKAGSYKNREGHLWVMGGSMSYPGSIFLTVKAAVQSGAGLVTAFIPEPLVPSFAARLPEAIWMGCPVTSGGGLSYETKAIWEKARGRCDALVVGPGLGSDSESHRLVGEVAAETSAPVILDAEALCPEIRSLVAKKNPTDVIATPHRNELYRLLGREPGADWTDEAFLEAARELGWHLLLKGPPFNRLTWGSGLAYVTTGGPVLARGGSGDILAGMIGRMVAREKANGGSDWAAALARSVYWHGAAAEEAAIMEGAETIRTSRILAYLSVALRKV